MRLSLRSLILKTREGRSSPRLAADFEKNELIGTVKKIIYRHPDTGFSVISLESARKDQMVTGVLPVIEEGEYVRLVGGYGYHKTYGRQFRVDRKVPHNTTDGIKRYLASRAIRGIGLKTAEKIVSHFGLKTLDIMDRTPERLTEVPSIGKKKLRTILDAWQVQRAYRMVELFLLSNNLAPKLAKKIIQFYGDETLNVLSKAPYRLATDIKGVGFISADAFARSIGIELDSKERITAAVVHALSKAEDQGHCYLTLADLVIELKDILKIELAVLEDKVAGCLVELVRTQHIVSKTLELEGSETTVIYLAELFYAECDVAAYIGELLGNDLAVDKFRLETWLAHYSQELATPLSEHQAEAVAKAATNRVFVLTGGPGVGKSTTANAIIKLIQSLGRDVALAAPTGRAAQRLAEITGEEARTIHRLLEWSPQSGGFQRNRENPLTSGAIIIDEASMLDLKLARSLLAAVAPTSQIIFIGDVDQLPSVGAGNFLADVINSTRVPYLRLNQVFRQAAQSHIVAYSHKINDGQLPVFTNARESDCKFIEVSEPEQAVLAIEKLLKDILPAKTSFDPIRDVQVLAPMKKSTLGTDNLNRAVQALLNPPRDAREYRRENESLRRHDKVIQVVNNYDLGVFNGDIGIVIDAGVQQGQVLVDFSGRQVAYAGEQARELRLAYAITIHKSQGSEFPVVIIPVSMQHYVMLQRNLIYTGLTRARKLAIFVGSKQALRQAVQSQVSLTRKTSLAAAIQLRVSP